MFVVQTHYQVSDSSAQALRYVRASLHIELQASQLHSEPLQKKGGREGERRGEVKGKRKKEREKEEEKDKLILGVHKESRS